MAAKDIEAGRGYVLLRIRNQMSQGLAAAEKRLKNFGRNVSAFGGVLAGAGFTSLLGFSSLAKTFSDSASELGDMANRTGLARDYLSQLAFAAKMSGTDMETVEAAARKSSDSLGSAAMGSKVAAETFKQLGFSVEELLSMSPENRFEALGKKIAGIRDPALRTAMAMNVFGKSGTGLIDMFSNLEAAKQQSDSLGLTFNDADIRKGEALGDAFDQLFATLKGVGMQIGSAISEPLTRLLNVASNVFAFISNFIRQNRQLVVTLVSVATILMATGIAILTFGTFAAALGFMIGGLIALFTALSAAIAVIFSPIGIVIGLFVVAGAGAIYFRNEIVKAVVSVGEWLRKLVDYAAVMIDAVIVVFGGFAKALASGNLALAARIAFVKMELEIFKVLSRIIVGFLSFLNTLSDKISEWSGSKIVLGRFDIKGLEAGRKSIEKVLQNEIAGMNSFSDMTYKGNPAKLLGTIVDTGGLAAGFVIDDWKKKISDLAGSLQQDVAGAFSMKSPQIAFPNFESTMMKSPAETKIASKGTFSAVGAALMSAGSDFNQQTARNTSILVQQNKEMLKKKGAQFK